MSCTMSLLVLLAAVMLCALPNALTASEQVDNEQQDPGVYDLLLNLLDKLTPAASDVQQTTDEFNEVDFVETDNFPEFHPEGEEEETDDEDTRLPSGMADTGERYVKRRYNNRPHVHKPGYRRVQKPGYGVTQKPGYAGHHKPGFGQNPNHYHNKDAELDKKVRMVSTSQGFYIRGGSRLPGHFLSLRHCIKICLRSPTCFAGDYNRYNKQCFTHSRKACDPLDVSRDSIHFSRVPCDRDLDEPTVLDATVLFGRYAPYGVPVYGVYSAMDCSRRCTSAGGGIASSPVGTVIREDFQLCFAIDYDFSHHKCYMHFRFYFENKLNGTAPNFPEQNICSETDGLLDTDYQSLLGVSSSIVHITFCPLF